MNKYETVRRIFQGRDGIATTRLLLEAGIHTSYIAELVRSNIISRILPDAILCMETMLYQYGYTDRTPDVWHIAVDKRLNRERLRIAYPPIRVHFVDRSCLEIGLTESVVDSTKMRVYDRERTICDVVRHSSRLRIRARATGKTTQLMLQLFCQEEFLRRLQLSPYHDRLILKGGLLLELIAEQSEHGGVRVKMVGRIKNTMTAFHIDVGVGDAIVPGPMERAIPTQLDGFIAPAVLSYSLESTVAEKLDAIISRMDLTSRMKDFYDLYYLACTVAFDARTLQEAIFQTLQRRGGRRRVRHRQRPRRSQQ